MSHICVNFSTSYNYTLVAKGLIDCNWLQQQFQQIIVFEIFYFACQCLQAMSALWTISLPFHLTQPHPDARQSNAWLQFDSRARTTTNEFTHTHNGCNIAYIDLKPMLHYINYIVFFFDQREASKKEIDVTTLFSWNARYGAVRQSREYVARIARVAINFPIIIWTVLENASSAWHVAILPNLFIHWFKICILCTAGTSIENCGLKLHLYCLIILKLA